MNLIASTPNPGWFAADAVQPQELVFSFFSRQSALVASVQINPMTARNHDRSKDVEVWTSTQSSTEGFTRVAAATLQREDRLQSVVFAPVEARYVKLRVVTTRGAREIDKPGAFPIGASRVKVLEGAAPGYVSIVERNPDLAALMKGVLPFAPAPDAKTTAAADSPLACSVQADTPRKSNFPQSREVLVISDSPLGYRALGWKSSVIDTQGLRDRKVVAGVNFTWTVPYAAAPANLVTDPRIDTVILAQVCEIKTQVSAAFKQALIAWVAAGHKLIIQDSDFCSPGLRFSAVSLRSHQPRRFWRQGRRPLPCTQPLGAFVITADNQLKSQHVVAGRGPTPIPCRSSATSATAAR